MSPLRLPRFLAAAVGLVLLAGLFCLPTDLDARRAPTLPKELSADLALVPGDCVGFVTISQKDLRTDPLLASLFELGYPSFAAELALPVAPEEIDRITWVVSGELGCLIIRTTRPYDAAKLIKKLKPGDRLEKEGKPDEVKEKKVAGKTITYKDIRVGRRDLPSGPECLSLRRGRRGWSAC